MTNVSFQIVVSTSICLATLGRVTMDVNVVLGIVNILSGNRYFFTHHGLVLNLIRDIYLVNMIVNLLLGIRYFFTHRVLVPILLRDLKLVNIIVNI